MATAMPPMGSGRRPWAFKRVYSVVALTLVVLGGVLYIVHRAATPPTPVKYLSALVRRGDLSEVFSATGEVVPTQTDTVTTRPSSHLQQLMVHAGETVSQGQTVARLTDPTLVSELAAAHATVVANQAQVAIDSSSATQNGRQAQLAQLVDSLQLAQASLARTEDHGQVAAPVAGTVSLSVSAGDVVSAGQSVGTVGGHTLTALVAGTVGSVAVANGQQVAMGTMLFRLTSPTLTQAVLSDDSQIAGLKSQIDKLTVQQQGASATLVQARAQLQQSQQAYLSAQQAVKALTITAPYDGVVTTLNPLTPGGKLLTISSATKVVTVSVPQTQIDQVHPGQSVRITLPALPATVLHGTVQNVASIGLYSNGVSTFPVTVTVPGRSAIRYGMSAQVNITVRTIHNALLVPLAALHSGGSRTTVEVVSGTGRHRVPVHILLENMTLAAVSSHHLSSGDRVITAVLGAPSGKLHLKAKGRALHRGRGGRKAKKAR